MYCQLGKHSALPFFPFQRLSVYQLRVGHLLCMVVNPTRRHHCKEGGMEEHVWGVVVLIKGLKGRVEGQGKDGATCNLSSNQQGVITAGRQGRCAGGGAGLEAGWRCRNRWSNLQPPFFPSSTHVQGATTAGGMAWGAGGVQARGGVAHVKGQGGRQGELREQLKNLP